MGPYILIFWIEGCATISVGNVIIVLLWLATKVEMIPWFAFYTRLVANRSVGNYRRFKMTACGLETENDFIVKQRCLLLVR